MADPVVLERVAEAMLHKGKALFTQHSYEDAIATFDTLIGDFGEQVDSELRKKVALALSNKVAALNLLGRANVAYATHDDLVDKYADAAIEAFDDTIRRFEDAVDP
jgi:tetratricopeptide (TPR) repeat protein